MHLIDGKRFHCFYKIVNLINGKFYYGIHSTNNLFDNYLGSGEVLKKAHKKYGKENFLKIIIMNFSSRASANNYERLIVNKDLIDNQMCYNMKTGGDNQFIMSDEVKLKISESGKIRFLTTKQWNTGLTKETHESLRILSENRTGSGSCMFGVPKSDETKKKMSIAHSGTKHYCYGKNQSKESNLRRSQHSADNKPCIIYGIEYRSITFAAQCLELTTPTVGSRIKSSCWKWTEWRLKQESPNKQPPKILCEINEVFYYKINQVCDQFNITRYEFNKRMESDSELWQSWKYYESDIGEIS